MTKTAVICIMAVGATDTNIMGMIFVATFKYLICKFVVAGLAVHFPFHAFHALAVFECMMTGKAWLTHIFTNMKFVVKFNETVIRMEHDLLR